LCSSVGITHLSELGLAVDSPPFSISGSKDVIATPDIDALAASAEPVWALT
jgi:hypothetical protein